MATAAKVLVPRWYDIFYFFNPTFSFRIHIDAVRFNMPANSEQGSLPFRLSRDNFTDDQAKFMLLFPPNRRYIFELSYECFEVLHRLNKQKAERNAKGADSTSMVFSDEDFNYMIPGKQQVADFVRFVEIFTTHSTARDYGTPLQPNDYWAKDLQRCSAYFHYQAMRNLVWSGKDDDLPNAEYRKMSWLNVLDCIVWTANWIPVYQPVRYERHRADDVCVVDRKHRMKRLQWVMTRLQSEEYFKSPLRRRCPLPSAKCFVCHEPVCYNTNKFHNRLVWSKTQKDKAYDQRHQKAKSANMLLACPYCKEEITGLLPGGPQKFKAILGDVMAFTGDPRHFTLRSSREEASKLANVERRARDETQVQEIRFCPFTNRFGVECSFAMPSEWPFRSVEKADPDG